MARLGRRFGPPLALMGLIWFLSAQPDLKTSLGLIDLVLRKIVHTAEFGLLWWLWHRALGFRRPWVAVAITVGYAGVDEVHQHFVEGRVGSPIDVAIDSVGIAAAWWLDGRWRRGRPGSEPAALGGDQDGLGAVDGAELAVDVVQVGADGARRE